jgi:hypothetical protein
VNEGGICSKSDGNVSDIVLILQCDKSWKVLQRVKEDRSVLHTIKEWKANWFGHVLHRYCLLKHVVEGKIEGRIEVAGRRGRKRKKLRMTWRTKEDTGNWMRNTRSHSVENSLWKSLWTCRKKDCRMKHEVHKQWEVDVLLHFLGNNCYVHAPQCYVNLYFALSFCKWKVALFSASDLISKCAVHNVQGSNLKHQLPSSS